MNRVKSIFFPLTLVIAGGLFSCRAPEVAKTPLPAPEENANTAESGDASEFAETRPRASVRDELTAVFSKGELELDFRKSYMASEAQLYTALYEGLFSYHPFTMEPVPAAAEKWEISEDKKQWTFTIRQDAKYWNGDDLKADDFRAAWISLLTPGSNAPYSSLFDVIKGAREYRTGVEKDPAKVGISAPGTKTLVVKLNAPAVFFPAMLCHHSFSPIHPSMVNKQNWSAAGASGVWEPPVSNGPFKLESMNDDTLILEKTSQYWDARRVLLKKITVKYTDEPEQASRLWNSGDARWLSGDFSWDALTDRSGIEVNAMFATHYYYICSGEKPWNDYRVRRALILALPWSEIRGTIGQPATTLIYPLSGYPEIEGLSDTNIEEAKKLLADAGYPDGAGLPDLVMRLTPSEEAARIGGLMATTWKEQLGVPVKVEVFPYNQYFNSLKEPGYTVGSSTWIGDFADPYTFLQMWRRDSNLNDARHSDDDFEKLMDRSMSEEGDARLATLAEAEKLLLERGSIIPIFHNLAVNVVDLGEIDGWYANALDIHPFKYLSFKALRPLPGVACGKTDTAKNS